MTIDALNDDKTNYQAGSPLVKRLSKGWLDRILDMIAGEEVHPVQNRYALICQNCRTHNGLALKEDFNRISKAIKVHCQRSVRYTLLTSFYRMNDIT